MDVLASLCLSSLLLLCTASSATFDWKELDTLLPKAISDHTATRLGDIVYLAGGCDAEQGNTWDEEARFFLCLSISQSFFGYNMVTGSTTNFPDMPMPRYRHAAVAVDNKIWLVGGRDTNDTIVGQVDVRKHRGAACVVFHYKSLYWNRAAANADADT